MVDIKRTSFTDIVKGREHEVCPQFRVTYCVFMHWDL